MAELVHQHDGKRHTLALMDGKTTIGKIYFKLDPSEIDDSLGVVTRTPNILSIDFIDCIRHRQKYKGAFNVLTQAAFESALHSGSIPNIIACVEKMGYGKRIFSSATYS